MSTPPPSHTQKDVESKVVKLQDYINKGHVKASIQLCDSLLKKVLITDDLHNILLKNKSRLMIQGKQYGSLIHFSKTLSKKQFSCISQEVSYAHYRLRNYAQALNAIKDVHAPLLRAQILYRLDHFEEAVGEYELALKDTEDPTVMGDVSINLSACKAALVLSREGASMPPLDHDQAMPECIYNQATALMGSKKFNDAKEYLKQAVEACEDNQIKAQAHYQLAYCDHQLGLPIHLPELGQDRLLNSLILMLGKKTTPRRLVSMMQSLMPKYASYQKHAIKYNLAVLHCESNNLARAGSIAKTLVSDEHFGGMATDLLRRMGEKD